MDVLNDFERIIICDKVTCTYAAGSQQPPTLLAVDGHHPKAFRQGMNTQPLLAGGHVGDLVPPLIRDAGLVPAKEPRDRGGDPEAHLPTLVVVSPVLVAPQPRVQLFADLRERDRYYAQ